MTNEPVQGGQGLGPGTGESHQGQVKPFLGRDPGRKKPAGEGLQGTEQSHAGFLCGVSGWTMLTRNGPGACNSA